MRETVEFCQRTNARNRGKVVIVFPAEDMNLVTANALLKTLKNRPVTPVCVGHPGRAPFATHGAQPLHGPYPELASARCVCRLVVRPGVAANQTAGLLRASGGRPAMACRWRSPVRMLRPGPGFRAPWRRVMLWQSKTGAARSWSMPCRAVSRLCALAVGAPPRYFEPADLPPPPLQDHLRGLGAWDQSLRQTRRVVDHPWNAGLMTEALVSAAKIALLAARTGLVNPVRRASVVE